MEESAEVVRDTQDPDKALDVAAAASSSFVSFFWDGVYYLGYTLSSIPCVLSVLLLTTAAFRLLHHAHFLDLILCVLLAVGLPKHHFVAS